MQALTNAAAYKSINHADRINLVLVIHHAVTAAAKLMKVIAAVVIQQNGTGVIAQTSIRALCILVLITAIAAAARVTAGMMHN